MSLLAASVVANVSRIAAGLVFVAAAITKLADNERWMTQSADLRVPRRLAAAVPWCELVVGAAIVAGVALPWPLLVAVGVLLVLTAWIVTHLLRGEHPPCACFGALSAAPLSWWHVARNGVLVLLAAVALVS